MQLKYYKDPVGNFGDDLNPWLWDKLLPGFIDNEDDGNIMLGVGTILEPWFIEDIPTNKRKFVVGSGAGMCIPTAKLDKSWEVICVRGPLTASYLGLDIDVAATDPAMCIRDFWPQSKNLKEKVGCMPHHKSLKRFNWKQVCQDAGLEYVDPEAAYLDTMEQISNLRLIITEAMHGAIVADAIRVPWFPLQISPTNYVGKWHDWGASIGMPIHFRPLPDLYDPLHEVSIQSVFEKGLRPGIYEMRQKSSRKERAQAVHLLQSYAEHYSSYLSDDKDLDRAIDIFRSKLQKIHKLV